MPRRKSTLTVSWSWYLDVTGTSTTNRFLRHDYLCFRDGFHSLMCRYTR